MVFHDYLKNSLDANERGAFVSLNFQLQICRSGFGIDCVLQVLLVAEKGTNFFELNI
jgi:hypothetical protein